jgi:surfeit locus 1 family protein
VNGIYDEQHQILLDNQVDHEVAGYHVLTPVLQPSGHPAIVIDRGWIPALNEHTAIPKVDTPKSMQHLTGYLWFPPSKFFTLQTTPDQSKWQSIWQNIDLVKYANLLPYKSLPVVIRLDDQAPSGFERNWPRPAEKIEMHLGYAMQWFGFAFAFFVIYLVVNFKKTEAPIEA